MKVTRKQLAREAGKHEKAWLEVRSDRPLQAVADMWNQAYTRLTCDERGFWFRTLRDSGDGFVLHTARLLYGKLAGTDSSYDLRMLMNTMDDKALLRAARAIARGGAWERLVCDNGNVVQDTHLVAKAYGLLRAVADGHYVGYAGEVAPQTRHEIEQLQEDVKRARAELDRMQERLVELGAQVDEARTEQRTL